MNLFDELEMLRSILNIDGAADALDALDRTSEHGMRVVDIDTWYSELEDDGISVIEFQQLVDRLIELQPVPVAIRYGMFGSEYFITNDGHELAKIIQVCLNALATRPRRAKEVIH